MIREIWTKYPTDTHYIVERDNGHVVAAAGPVTQSEVINRWPKPFEFISDPDLVAKLDGQQDYYQRAIVDPNPNAIVTEPRLLRDDDLLIVRPSNADNEGRLRYTVLIGGPQLDNASYDVAWDGEGVARPTTMSFGEIKRHVPQSGVNWLNKAATDPVRLGYGGPIPQR